MEPAVNTEMKRRLLLVLCVAVIKEACHWIFHDNNLLNTILKLLAGVVILLICYGVRNRPGTIDQKLTLIAVVVYIIADLLIKWIFFASGVLFLIGHLLLIISFWFQRKPNKKGIILWAVLTVIEAVLVIALGPVIAPSLSTLFCCQIAFYSAVLIMMAVSAVYQVKTVAVAGILFLISDLLLVVSVVVPVIEWIHIPSILLFYLSIGLFLLHCAGTDQNK